MPAKLQAVNPVIEVRNVTDAIAFYKQLGFELAFRDSPDDPKYAGVRRDNVEIHFQWHDEKDFAGHRVIYRFYVDDPDALYEEFEKNNPNADRKPVCDTTWGTREFHMRDPDGNGL